MTARPLGHVLFVVPNAVGDPTGNETTVQRHARLLRERDLTVELLRPGDDLADAPGHLRAGVVHAYHAHRCGPRALWLAESLHVPLVVSITGTDLSVDLLRADRRDVVRDVLRRARAVLCGNAHEEEIARALAPDARSVVVLPKSVAVPELLPEPSLARDEGEIVVLAAANVRPVKRLDVAVRAVAGLRAEGHRARLVVAGRVLDTEEDARIAELCGGAAEWAAIRQPPVPHDRMGGLFAAADIVLNTSDAEGASNAILEAMAHGRAVVASDVAGNAELLNRDGSVGRLYPTEHHEDGTVTHDIRALVATLCELAGDRAARRRLGDAARERCRAHHREDSEADALLAAYAAATA